MRYIAFLYKETDSDFGVTFPDFPGCVTAGETLEEASRNAAEALAFHIEGMREDGDDIPVPSSLDDLADNEELKESVAFYVEIPDRDQVVRFNVTARESQLARIDKAAAASGLSRSAFLVSAAIERTESRHSP